MLIPPVLSSVTNSSTQYVDDSSLARASYLSTSLGEKGRSVRTKIVHFSMALYIVSANQKKTLTSKPFMSPILCKCDLLLSLLLSENHT